MPPEWVRLLPKLEAEHIVGGRARFTTHTYSAREVGIQYMYCMRVHFRMASVGHAC